jgi:hypothetical protein
MQYDYIIVGGGPSGMTLAHILPGDKKILIIERQKTLGGCHRVNRVPGNVGDPIDSSMINRYFTEHGPRIYSSAYVNFNKILKDLGTSLDDSFTGYNFKISEIGSKSIPDFSGSEMTKLIGAFLIFMVYPNYGADISMSDFAKDFSTGTKDYIDRLCRLTDGAGYDRYTLKEFLSIINDQGPQQLYQPKEPMDVGVLTKWEKYLLDKGVKIIKDTEVKTIEVNNGKVVSVNGTYYADRFILAMPPKEIYNILSAQTGGIKDAFGPFNDFSNYAEQTNYIEYIPISFHWKTKLNIPKVYGFPASDWGLAFIVLSDYMNSVDIGSQGTVISTAITYTDTKSKNTGKSATDSTEQELLKEAFEQLKLSYPDLPDPDQSILSPTVKRIGNRWKTDDTAYVSVSGLEPFKNKSPVYSNLYNLGPYNGNEKYHFTSLESAVSNAFALGNELEGLGLAISGFTTVRQILGIIIIVIMVLIISAVMLYKRLRRKGLKRS